MTRRERFWCIVAAVLAVVLAWRLVAEWRLENAAWGRGASRETVPGAVLADGQAVATNRVARVYEWARAEEEHLARQGWEIPYHVIAVYSPMGANGFTSIGQKPTIYHVALAAWTIPGEGQVRRTTAHEVAHILMHAAGVKQSEQLADQFSWCFGSPKARTDAEWIVRGEADCAGLADQLKTAGGLS